MNIVYAREAYAESQDKKTRTRRTSPPVYAVGDNGELSQEEREAMLTGWKYAAMQRETIAFYAQCPGQTWKNILSLGDAPCEHYAIQEVAFRRDGPDREQLRTKSLIAAGNQSISFMTFGLKWMATLMPIYVGFDGDFTLDMNSGDRREEHVRVLGNWEDVKKVHRKAIATKIAVLVKEKLDKNGETKKKVRFVVDMRRTGVNGKVYVYERIVLPRGRDLVDSVLDLMEGQMGRRQAEVELLVIDISDAFLNLLIHEAERQ